MENEEKDTSEKLSVSVQMKTSYLFDFLYQHSYHGFYGVLNYGFSLFAVILLLCGVGKDNAVTTVALVVLALLFTVINPLLLYQKAAKQKRMVPAFQKPLQYELDETGVTCHQEAERVTFNWSDIAMLRETGKNLILYFGAANAVVFPKAELADKLPAVKELLRKARPDLTKKLK